MSIGFDAVANYAIANGARELNQAHIVASPLPAIFSESANMHVEPGNECAGPVMHEYENTGVKASGSTPVSDQEQNPYNMAKLPWRYPWSTVVLDGVEVSKNLGGARITDWAYGNPIGDMNAGSRNTLINMVSPRFTNAKMSLETMMAEDFYNKRIEADGEGVDGIDVITEADTAYAGIGYKELGTLRTTSAVMGNKPYIWNPIHKDYGTTTITVENIILMATDLQKFQADIADGQTQSLKVYVLMSVERYTHLVHSGKFEDNRWRGSSDDTNLGPSRRIEDVRTGTVVYADAFMDGAHNNTIFFFLQGSVKKRKQKEETFTEMMAPGRLAFNRERVLWEFRDECNYLCTARCQTGWLKGAI